MASPETQEAAAKQRIIKHMNADHHDSVRRCTPTPPQHMESDCNTDSSLCGSLRLEKPQAESQCTDD
jgi:hypothetical protein